MSADEWIEKLEGRGAMTRLDDEELRELVEACEVRILHSGEPLWMPGTRRSEAFVLVSGRIERSTKTHSGRKSREYAEPGTILSISALVHPWEYHSSAYARDRTELLVLTYDAFHALFDARRAVGYRLVDAIADYLVADMRDANARLEDVFGRPAETLRMLRRRVREDTKA